MHRGSGPTTRRAPTGPLVSTLGLALVLGAACARRDGTSTTHDDGVPSAPAGSSSSSAPREVSTLGASHTDASHTDASVPVTPSLDDAARAGTCPTKKDAHVGILVSPRQPVVGRPMRILAATTELEGPLAIRIERAGRSLDVAATARGGVPTSVTASVTPTEPGPLTVVVGTEGRGLSCLDVTVAPGPPSSLPRPASTSVWPARRAWTSAEEALFSAWVRETFHAPRGAELAWASLREVTSDPTRNVLHGFYGWNEDDAGEAGLELRPDCADTPYFIRAYYAWKRELPFAYRQCSRGVGEAPRCGALHTSVDAPEHGTAPGKPGELGVVQQFFGRSIGWGVHSGNGRTAFGDDATDFYPVELSPRGLRPGAIYADPYGHVFLLVEHMPKEGTAPGILYAIDGQPDGSITRKRFWEGNFVWNPDPSLGGSGFKRFRPLDVVRDGDQRRVHAATDAEIGKRPGYGDVSREQATLSPPAFYDRMDHLITPGRRDPFVAQAEAIQALYEAALVRVTSVDNAEAHVKEGTLVPMPRGHAVFETTGAWENFSTPGRDLRLLVAIDLVRGFGDKVARNPDVYLPEGKTMEALRAELEGAREGQLASPARSFTYTRSDGSPFRLTLVELMARAPALEAAYNPNDCPEARWGAPEGSDERSTCRRRAPPDQQRAMEAYRVWFRERRRPPRGDAGPKVP